MTRVILSSLLPCVIVCLATRAQRRAQPRIDVIDALERAQARHECGCDRSAFRARQTRVGVGVDGGDTFHKECLDAHDDDDIDDDDATARAHRASSSADDARCVCPPMRALRALDGDDEDARGVGDYDASCRSNDSNHTPQTLTRRATRVRARSHAGRRARAMRDARVSSSSSRSDGRAASGRHAASPMSATSHSTNTTNTNTNTTTNTATLEARLAHCSWCFHFTSHVRVNGGSGGRAAYACGACARRTTRCGAKHCSAMARGGDGWDDTKCLACAGIFASWRTTSAEVIEREMSPRGWCSWCGEDGRHRVTRSVGSRGTYLSHCSTCARGTHKCERCADGFARVGDGRCGKCAGFVEDWNCGTETFTSATRRVGWCSWCGERCAHVKRGIKGNETYECMVCGGGTAPCERCGDESEVMRKRSRPGGGSCARCRAADAPSKKINIGGYVSIPTFGAITSSLKRAMSGVASTSGASEEEIARKWLVRAAKREAADVQSGYVFDILDRESDFRDKAYRAGLIRPFLLLATLPPRERVRLGMRLGVSLSRSSSYLDAHAEAWKVLREPMCGLQTRGGDVSRVVEKVTGVGRGANWLDILYSALTLGASTGKCPAIDPRELATLPIMRSPGHALFALRVAAHPAVNAYEVAALRLVSHAQRGRLTPASGVTLDAVCKHPSMDVLKSRLRRSYPRNVDEIARYTVTAAFASSPWASSSASRGTSPADVQIIADDVYGMLLEGKPLHRRVTTNRDDPHDVDDDTSQISRGAPSLLGALAASTSMGFASFTAAQFAPSKFAVLTPRDILDLTTGVRTPTLTSSGIFEPVAVMLLHNVLLSARGVQIDDHLPSDAKKLSRDALNAVRSPSVAATPKPTVSEGSQSPGDGDGGDSPWAPKYAHLEDEGASARLEELQEAEESADMLQRYINSLSMEDFAFDGDDE